MKKGSNKKKEVSISAIEEGTVIDHIPSDETFRVADILKLSNLKNTVSVAAFLDSKKMGTKGIIKVGSKFLTQDEVNKIAIVAPRATVNIIKDYNVKGKLNVNVPETLANIIKCSNPNCITNNEEVETSFSIKETKPLVVKCYYCERSMKKGDIEIL